MKRTIKITIEYDGTDFNGWQIQNPKERTVQGEFERVLKILFKKHIRVYGSGRTDSGVHALGQVAHFQIHSPMSCEELHRALNANLPPDAVVLKVEEAQDGFHAQFQAKRKTYRYTILNRPFREACQRRFIYFYPYPLKVNRMRLAAKELTGTKDFRAFMSSNPRRREHDRNKSTVRKVSRLDIRKRKDHIIIEIEADGFLYKMVRNITGTLIEAGAGRINPSGIKTILSSKTRTQPGTTAPACGLTLVEVKY